MRRTVGRTREAIVTAATAEFAAAGFAGATVDTIARRAGVNKAMIYYHFEDKRALYLEVLHDVFRSLGHRTREVATSHTAPDQKIRAFIEAVDAEASARPCFPPIMMRELADDAARLDTEALRLMSGVLGNLRTILDEGARLGRFRPVNPLLTYFTLISPVIVFRATTPVRTAMARSRVVDTREVTPAVFIAHLQEVTLSALAPIARRPRAPHRACRPLAPRSGDRA